MNSSTPTNKLLAALNARPIFRADFDEAKRSLAIKMERAFTILADFGTDDYRTLYATELFRCSDFRALRTFAKRLDAMSSPTKRCGVSDRLYAAARAYAATWLPVADRIDAAKTAIVSGRKPSTPLRTTEPRTLKNTGTCSICDHNVKLDGGRIVDHGFTLRFGGRNGKCYGVGFHPIEVSTEGAEKLLAILRTRVERLAKRAAELKALPADATVKSFNPHTGKAKQVPARTIFYRVEGELSATEYEVKEFAAKVANWAPRALPDEKF